MLALLLVLAASSAQAQTPAVVFAAAQQQPLAMIGGSGQVTPSVTATYSGYGPPNGAWTMELLVLWRGSLGWELGGAGAGGGMGGGPVTQFVIIGGRTIELQFDQESRQVRLGTEVLDLGESNVLLIDDVDSVRGPRIVGTARVQGVVERFVDPLVSLISRSPELLDFVQCGMPLSDPKMQQWMELRCAQLGGTISQGAPNMYRR
jgi:hypothetical protein